MHSSRSYTVLVSLLVGAIILYLTVSSKGLISSGMAAGACAIIILGFVPTLVYFNSTSEQKLIPLLPLHALFYAVAYGMTVFSGHIMWYGVDDDVISYSIFLTVAGLVVLFFGYYGSRRALSNVKPLRLSANTSDNRLFFLGWFFYTFYILCFYIPGLAQIPTISQMIEPAGSLGIGVLISQALKGHGNRFHRLIIYFLALPLLLIVRTSTGALYLPMITVVFVSVLYWQQKRRILWYLITPAIALLLLLNPIKSQFRALTWSGEFTKITPIEKGVLLLDFVSAQYLHQGGRDIDLVPEANVNRLACINLLAGVVARSPDPVPYWMGGSYATLFVSFIPRILWPDKPVNTISVEFGHRYGFMPEYDTTTAFNMPWLVEFYANFGVVGVLCGMLFIGILLRYLMQKLCPPNPSTLESVLGLTLVVRLWFPEQSFSIVGGGLFLTTVVFYLLLKKMSK